MTNKYDFSKQISEALLEYGDKVIRVVEDSVVMTGNATMPIVEAKSPGSSESEGKYKKGWRFKLWSESSYYTGFTIHNVARPQITHLLEHGHLTRDGKTRVDKVEHIVPAEEWAANYLEKVLKGQIERL